MGKFTRRLKSAASATSKTALALVLAISLTPMEVLAENSSTQAYDVEESPIESSQTDTAENNQPEDLDSSGPAPAGDVEESASSEENKDKERDKKEDETSESISEGAADESKAAFVASEEGLEALSVEGTATESEDAAAELLARDTELTSSQAQKRAHTLISTLSDDDAGNSQADEGKRSGDGTDIDNITAVWITPDTTDNGDDSLLYLKAQGNSDLSAILRVTYSLSGQHDYSAGDIVITIPENIFKNRNDGYEGTMVIPFPEDPSTRQAWNYKLIDGNYVIANTRTMNAATQGFMEFGFYGLTPDQIVDMGISDEFKAKIEVVTHLGNTLSATSGSLMAQIDTESVITGATKRITNGYPTTVDANSPLVPDSFREMYPNEKAFVLSSWYMNPYLSSNNNTPFTLSMVDSNATVTDSKGGTDYRGHIVGVGGSNLGSQIIDGENGSSLPGQTATADVYDGYLASNMSNRYTTISMIYPLSQFEVGERYTFKNQVEYTLTEKDNSPNDPDGQKTTKASSSATASWTYIEPQFIEPTGNFNIFKWGNSSTSFDNSSYLNETKNMLGYEYGDVSSTSILTNHGYWGDYPSAMSKIAEGEDVTISYTVNSVGFLLPWTYEGDGTENEMRKLSNYGKKDVTMVSEETGLSVGAIQLQLGTDYTYSSIEFPVAPIVWNATAVNLTEEGDMIAWGDASLGNYDLNRNHADKPDVTVQVQAADGSWSDYVVVNWNTGSPIVSAADGVTLAEGAVHGTKIDLPEDITSVRTVVTTRVDAVNYYMRVNTKLSAEGYAKVLTENAFAESNNPQASIYNSVNMKAYSEDGDMNDPDTALVSIDKTARDRIAGYTNETRASLTKSAAFDIGKDIDAANSLVTVHYSAEMTDRSYISDLDTYNAAVEEGGINPTSSGKWCDLLPKGMMPDLSTVKLRDNDTVKNVYTIDNYKGSGRTLLVVEADFTPQPSYYTEDSVRYCQDVITVSFDAKTTFAAIQDYGNHTHNVVAFVSDSDQLGTVPGYVGEPDNTRGVVDSETGQSKYNNFGTWSAFETDEERDALANLVPDNDNPSVLYAGAYCELSQLNTGETSLNKLVMVNNDGWWSNGLYAGDSDRADNERVVYAGGNYAYRLSIGSGDNTETSGVVLYDSLENFTAEQGNETIDIDAPRWQGTLASVDVSALEAAGVAPVVYYSTVSNLQLSRGGNDNANPIEENINLSNSSVWVKASDYTGSLSDVKAVAIDASKKADGTDFIIEPNSVIAAYLYMRAPQGEAADAYIKADAHAYNNVFAQATSTQTQTHVSETNFIRQDYVKVGLEEYKIIVDKVWDDNNDQDGKRTDSVKVHLYADGGDTEKTITLDSDNNWSDAFRYLPYHNDDGSRIIYSLVEDSEDPDLASYYTSSISPANSDGTKLTVTNKHTPEVTKITGSKTWVDDNESVRPTSITVRLYANGALYSTKTVIPDTQGNWNYSFTDVPVYKDGKAVEYTVRESRNGVESYISTVDGTDVTNAYNPYGDLRFSKATRNTTTASSDQEFSFTVTLTKDGAPIEGEYEYVVLDEQGKKIEGKAGAVSSGQQIVIAGGQTVHIKDLPEYIDYDISEESEAGFTLASAEAAEGQIAPNKTTEASFVNEYASSTSINLRASKSLTGRALSAYRFRFQLLDEGVTNVQGETLQEATGEVVRTASNSRGSDATESGFDDDGNIVQDAPVTFSAIKYTQADDGKVYHYRLVEQDTERLGYEYSTAVYHVAVALTDNGDGTMSSEVTYYADDNGVAGEEISGPEAVQFDNVYTSKGSTTLQAFKTLTGGKLEEEQFAFEVVDAATGEVVKAATNAADGRVIFDPLTYDQTDDGKTFTYAIREVDGGDDDIVYDGHYSLVQVSVSDNGDGTMNVVSEIEGIEAECWVCGGDGTVGEGDEATACEACGHDGKITGSDTSYMFENKMKDGELTIQKTVAEGDSDQLFSFLVELRNENGQPVTLTQEMIDGLVADQVTGDTDAGAGNKDAADTSSSDQKEADTATSSGSSTSSSASGGISLMSIVDETTVTSNGHTYTWSIDDDGVLTISGEISYANPTRTAYPWNSYRDRITSVVFTEGSKAFDSLANAFCSCPSMTSCDLSNLDTSNVTSMASMFYYSNKLETVNLSGVNTSNVTNMASMFSYCNALTSLDVSGFDTSRVTNMSSMFQACTTLTALDVSNFNTSRVTNMASMFSGCRKLENLDVSNFNTSRVTSMYAMFENCLVLEELDVSRFNTSNVTSMSKMFYGCSKLANIDVSNFKTSKVTTFSEMFRGCNSVVSLDVSKFDTSNATAIGSMFMGCSSLTSIDVSNFNTSKVTGFGQIFDGCSSLTTLDLHNFDVSNASNSSFVNPFNGMIRNCTSLETLNIAFIEGDSDRPRLLNYYLLANLPKLKEITMNPKYIRSGARYLDGTWAYKDGDTVDTSELYKGSGVDGKEGLSFESDYDVIPPEEGAGTYVRYEPGSITYYSDASKTDSFTTGSINWLDPQTIANKPSGWFVPNGKFLGWNTQPDGSGEKYSEGEVRDYVTNTGDLELYAWWWSPDSSIEQVSEGVYRVTIPGDTQLTIPSLPANTSYAVSEETPAGWSLVSSGNTSGTIPANGNVTSMFTNKYTPGETTASILATKTIDGVPASSADDFTFELWEEVWGNRTLLETVSVSDGGAVNFSTLKYTSRGTHNYIIREVAGTDSTISYDSIEERVSVAVIDNGEGVLSATVTYGDPMYFDTDPGRAAFANYHKPGSILLSKNAQGGENTDFKFSVTLSGQPYAGYYFVNGDEFFTEDGIIKLKGGQSAQINYISHGVTYSVEEVDVPEWWEQTDSTNASGTVSAADTSEVSFTNEYKYRATGIVNLQANKTMSVGGAESGQFEFALHEVGAVGDSPTGNPIETVRNAGTIDNVARIAFSTIAYDQTQVGTHVYAITEVNDGQDGIVYDSSVKYATVTVSDNGNGTLDTNVVYSDADNDASNNNTFQNGYEPRSLSVTKAIANDDLSDAAASAEFSMKLTLKGMDGSSVENTPYVIQDASGKQISSGKVSDGATVALKGGQTLMLPELPYKGTWSVDEVDIPNGWNRDSITVSAGTLVADMETMVTNSYDASGQVPLHTQKSFEGAELAAGQFTFQLVDADGDTHSVLKEATNDADGKVEFEPLEYGLSDIGEHHYQIIEVDDGQENIAYDSSVIDVTVTVTDKGDGTLDCKVSYSDENGFLNSLFVELARTGGAGVGLAGLAIVVLGLVLAVYRRRTHGQRGYSSLSSRS